MIDRFRRRLMCRVLLATLLAVGLASPVSSIGPMPFAVPSCKPVPQFSLLTRTAAANLFLFDNATLNTVLMQVKAETYSEAMPITYSLKNDDPYFKIDPVSGIITLYNALDQTKKNYTFVIVAKDSAQYPDQQTSYLTANVRILVTKIKAPTFNDDVPYYAAVSDVILPGSIIYDGILVSDSSAGQNGNVNVFCDKNSYDSIDGLIACSYFAIETQRITPMTYKCYVRLLTKLDHRVKRNFIIPIKAQLANQPNLVSSAYMVVEVTNSILQAPRFVNSSYLVTINPQTKVNTNVLLLSATNFQMNNVMNASFSVSDPNGLFAMAPGLPGCDPSICSQYLQLVTPVQSITYYSFTVVFMIETISRKIMSTSAQVSVVIERPKMAQGPPIFLNTPYAFLISENLKSGSVARNVTISVYEQEKLSIYTSGFFLVLLNPDLTVCVDTFDLVPNYGEGLLMATLKLKPNTVLDYEKGQTRFDFIIKAISRTAPSLASYANLTILVQDYNEYAPMFSSNSYTAVINNPENYQIDDTIFQLTAYDLDANGVGASFTYGLAGPHQDRFYVDPSGSVRLLKQFNLNNDYEHFYNLTLTATDCGGLSNFTNLLVYLNATSTAYLKQSQFECALIGAKSEINLADSQTLLPALFIPVNSLYNLKFFLWQTIPFTSKIDVDSVTGQIRLNSPLDYDFLLKNDRINVYVQVYQIQNLTINNNPMYLSSIVCSATIYLQSFNLSLINKPRQPYFLRQYSTVVDRESVFKNVPLIKVDAISMNQNMFLPLTYTLLNDHNQSFVIDSTQGFIYPRSDLSLSPRTYTLQVQATDPIDQSYSVTNVIIVVILKSGNKLKCNTNYLIIKLNQNDLMMNQSVPMVLGNLVCTSNSLFNDTVISYDISRPLSTFDCSGNQISYIPYLGINSKSGQIVSFEQLSRDKFCESIFSINVRKDDVSIFIPFKLILGKSQSYGKPVFTHNSSAIIYLNNYVNLGAYVTTVVAYDTVQMELIKNYEIIWQPAIGFGNLNLFKIEKTTGVIYLNAPLDPGINYGTSKTIATVTVRATSPNGAASETSVYVDYSKLVDNYLYTSISFDPSLPFDVTVNDEMIISEPIYKANVYCFLPFYFQQPRTPGLLASVPCGQVQYSLKYISDPTNSTNFIIDQNSGYIYMTTNNIQNRQLQNKYLLTIEASNTNQINVPTLARYNYSIQRNFTLTMANLARNSAPEFETSLYIVQILDSTPADSIILSMRYKNSNDPNNRVQFSIDQPSNIQVENYFTLRYLPNLQVIYLIVKSSPLPSDKPDVNFVVRISNLDAQPTDLQASTAAQVNVRILASESSQAVSFPSFILPPLANMVVYINATNGTIPNNTFVYQLRAISQNQHSLIVYSIINQDSFTLNHFYIEYNSIRVLNEFRYDMLNRKVAYLIFIQAIDSLNPANGIAYTTLEVRLNNLFDVFPYFNRDRTSGHIYLTVSEKTSFNASIFDLKPLLVKPASVDISKLIFYVFDAAYPYRISDQFYVDPFRHTTIQLLRPLDAKVKDLYQIFVYVTLTPLNGSCYYNMPDSNNTALLFFDIKVIVQNKNRPRFIEATEYMVVEEITPINYPIGYVVANTNFNDSIYYYFETCEYVTKSIVYKDLSFCNLFQIDPNYGVISTNSSYFGSFKNDNFYIRVVAAYRADYTARNYIDVRIYVANSAEKARLLFSRAPLQAMTEFFRDLKTQLNNALNDKYNGLYYFDFYSYAIPNSVSDFSELDACFYVINKKELYVLPYQRTRNLLLGYDGVKRLLGAFSVSSIQRCSNREDRNIYGSSLYNVETSEWKFTSVSIGLLVMAALTLLLTLIAIASLIICWASHMRHALLAPNVECETLDTDSNSKKHRPHTHSDFKLGL